MLTALAYKETATAGSNYTPWELTKAIVGLRSKAFKGQGQRYGDNGAIAEVVLKSKVKVVTSERKQDI